MKKLIIISMIATGICVSCNDYLDFEPRTLLTPETALSTEEGLVLALNGVYSSLQKAGYFGTELIIIADAATDNGAWPADREAAGTNADRLPYAYSLDLNVNNTASEFWVDGYVTIAVSTISWTGLRMRSSIAILKTASGPNAWPSGP
ncbi:MAG: hypothetical protein EHM46_04530 [Bacteroidetes bacterium]|nr:MAG: hypothetical protein EHM46_04530 [Bacteroidota bacterium]